MYRDWIELLNFVIVRSMIGFSLMCRNVLDGDQAEEAGEAGEGEDDPPIIIPIPSEPRERRRETKRERTLEREKSKGAQPVEPGANQDASFFDALALKLAGMRLIPVATRVRIDCGCAFSF